MLHFCMKLTEIFHKAIDLKINKIKNKKVNSMAKAKKAKKSAKKKNMKKIINRKKNVCEFC